MTTFIAAWLGHHHGGREFPSSVHGTMAKIITFVLIVQTACGVFLKLHVLEGTVRPWVKRVHGPLGMAFPVIGWTQMLFGVATAFGYCRGGNLGQCAAHYIMGSAFIGYAAILVIMLNLGGRWLARTGQSQEMLDSAVITVWGIINTFTEHHGGPWTHKDMQHTMMGVLWWAGGMLGLFLSRKGRRSFVPAAIIVMTGWGMSAHTQSLMISTKIHAMFGYALMAAGVCRIIEVCFVLHDQPTPPGLARVFQQLPPYLLTLGGTLFMSATDEELRHADDVGIDYVSYALFDFSLSFIIYLVISGLVHLYATTGRNAAKYAELDTVNADAEGYAKLNQNPHTNGGPREVLHDVGEEEDDGPEAYELTDRGSHSGDSDAVKIGGEDEVDWLARGARGQGVRL